MSEAITKTSGGATDAPWAESVADVLIALAVDGERGLDDAEAMRRRRRWGSNVVPGPAGRRLLSIFVDQFRSVVVLLLLGAGALAVLLSEFSEGMAILAVVFINGVIGFVTEWRAFRSMEALRQLTRIDAVVLRGGDVKRAPAAALVPGDVVLLEAGDIVPADLRLIRAAKLQSNESTLTGESLPVSKHTEPLSADTRVLDRHNLAFKGTSITRGAGRGIVTATGLHTEFGKIFAQVSGAETPQTPLEKRLDMLGRRLAWAVIAVAVMIALVGVLSGRELFLAIQVAIALAVAAIPEGLPIVATIALARGMWRMARRNALITRLSAVETLGATSVILTDKTGTLTENRMELTTLQLDSGDVSVESGPEPLSADFLIDGVPVDSRTADLVDELLKVSVLCNNASLQRAEGSDLRSVGDPTEVALLFAAARRSIWRDPVLAQMPEVHEDPFDSDTKRMVTVHRDDGSFFVAVKGAPEVVIDRCTKVRTINGDSMLTPQQRMAWLNRADGLGRRGLRTLALARKSIAERDEDTFADLVLLGVVGLEDPPRDGVSDAIRRCREAGVRVVMVTGDHAATAENIAVMTGIIEERSSSAVHIGGGELEASMTEGDERGLLGARVFSRVTPEQKLGLIDFYQRHNHVVAMTGDGVNDAPALKKANIGVAMGIRGTAVAKEAAAMVLQDDDFGTIVDAVSQGRAIFENIRKFVVYLLSCNISEILIVSLATIAGAPLPLLPLQILFLNLVTDVFPALALGVGRGSGDLMHKKPRLSGEPILTRWHWSLITIHGVVISSTVLTAMAIAVLVLDMETEQAVTVSFCTLAFAQMWHVFNMREPSAHWINNEITRNLWVWVALATCLALMLAAIYAPLLRDLLAVTTPDTDGWTLILVASIVPVLLAPAAQALVRRVASKGATTATGPSFES